MIRHVIHNNIQHEKHPFRTSETPHKALEKEHAPIMNLLTQRQQILLCPEILVQIHHIGNPIPRIIRSVLCHPLDPSTNRTDPNGIKTHALDVIEMVQETPPSSAAVGAIRDVAGGGCAVVCAGEAVDHDLVNCARTPLVFGSCGRGCGEKEDSGKPDMYAGPDGCKHGSCIVKKVFLQ